MAFSKECTAEHRERWAGIGDLQEGGPPNLAGHQVMRQMKLGFRWGAVHLSLPVPVGA